MGHLPEILSYQSILYTTSTNITGRSPFYIQITLLTSFEIVHTSCGGRTPKIDVVGVDGQRSRRTIPLRTIIGARHYYIPSTMAPERAVAVVMAMVMMVWQRLKCLEVPLVGSV